MQPEGGRHPLHRFLATVLAGTVYEPRHQPPAPRTHPMRATLIRILLLAAAIAGWHGTAAAQERVRHALGDFEYAASANGVLIAAPHGTFDAYTDALAVSVAGHLGAGYVVARHFTPNRVRINVNRPTEGAFSACANEAQTERAADVYAGYRAVVMRAASAGPLDLYVELHGNSNPRSAQYVEVATVGMSDAQARRAKDAFPVMLERARQRAPAYPDLELLIEPIDRLNFTASCAKKLGIFAGEPVRRGVHVELPRAAREGDALQGSALLIADLVRELLKAQP